MKCYLTNDLGFRRELPAQSMKIIDVKFNAQFCIEEPDADLKISFNGVEQNFNVKASNLKFPCTFDGAGNCNIQLDSADFQIRYKIEQTTHYKLNEEVCVDLLDFERHCQICADEGILTFEDLFMNIESGDINLLRLIDPLTGLAEDKIIEEILRAMPYALEICSKPHQHLRIEQEILNVEFVKRITSDTLQHLAAHSEHWKAKTIAGLIPDRLLAQTFEDELNIYENIFFRMVIQKALSIVEKKAAIWRQAIAQKDAMVAWEHYGIAFGDYRRMRILQSIMPKSQLIQEMVLTDEQEAAKKKLEQVERHLLNISSSNFYISLDKNIRLMLPIFPTNILTMDSRYRQMYILWNKLQHIQKEKSTEMENALQRIDAAYFLYVFVLMVYGLKQIDVNFDTDSRITFDENNFKFIANADSKFFKFEFTREVWRNIPYIKISMTSKKFYRLKNPLKNDDLKIVLEKFPTDIIFDSAQNTLTFNGDFEILRSDELKNIFKQKKGHEHTFNKHFEKVDKIWRNFLDDAYNKKPAQNTFTIALVPIAISLGDDEHFLNVGVDNLYDSLKNLSRENFAGTDITILALPTDVYARFLVDLNNSQQYSRLINYGEHFLDADAKIFGNYKFGLIPVTMTDVNSIQRLIKIVKLHMMKNFLEWELDENICPYCGSNNIFKVQGNLRQCNDCKITWGDTQCANESCRKVFKWIRPSVNAAKNDVEKFFGWDLILLKENMFGVTTIVDFDFDTSEKNIARYIPRCPHCGFSNAD